MASLQAALASVQTLLQDHADETTVLPDRRATDAGWRPEIDRGLPARRHPTGGDG